MRLICIAALVCLAALLPTGCATLQEQIEDYDHEEAVERSEWWLDRSQEFMTWWDEVQENKP